MFLYCRNYQNLKKLTPVVNSWERCTVVGISQTYLDTEHSFLPHDYRCPREIMSGRCCSLLLKIGPTWFTTFWVLAIMLLFLCPFCTSQTFSTIQNIKSWLPYGSKQRVRAEKSQPLVKAVYDALLYFPAIVSSTANESSLSEAAGRRNEKTSHRPRPEPQHPHLNNKGTLPAFPCYDSLNRCSLQSFKKANDQMLDQIHYSQNILIESLCFHFGFLLF